MKCLECGADIYEGVKKCPYCKTLTAGNTDEDKFRDFDFKYMIESSEQLEEIERTARAGIKKKTGMFSGFSFAKLRKRLHIPTIRRISKNTEVTGGDKSAESQDSKSAAVRAQEIAKTAAQKAAEFVPEGMARYTVRSSDGEEVETAARSSYEAEDNSLGTYKRVSRNTPKRNRRRSNKRGIAALFVGLVLVVAVVVGIVALICSAFANGETVKSYTYIKDNSLFLVYKGEKVTLTESLITENYVRNITAGNTEDATENGAAQGFSVEKIAAESNIVKITADGKRVYFFENYDPETGSGALKYVDKGKAKKITEIAQAVHNSIVFSEDGRKILYLRTTDKNGDMGVLYYWHSKIKEPFEISTDIDHGTFTFGGKDEWAMFIENFNRIEMSGDLFVKSLGDADEDKVKIDSGVCKVFGSNPGHAAYIYAKGWDTATEAFDIYAVNKKGRTIRLGEKTKREPYMKETKDSLLVFGMADEGGDNLYEVDINSGKKEKIASDVSDIIMLSENEKTLIYNKVYEKNSTVFARNAEYYAYTYGKEPQRIANNVVADEKIVSGQPQIAISKDGKTILYIGGYDDVKGGGTLKLCTYKRGKASEEKTITEGVYSCFVTTNDEFVVLKDYSRSKNVADAYVLDGNELRPFKDEVCPELFEISEDGKHIYCVMEIDAKSKMGNLERFTFKGKSKTIAKGVSDFELNADDVLVFANANADSGKFDFKLYRGEKNKLVDIDTSVDFMAIK